MIWKSAIFLENIISFAKLIIILTINFRTHVLKYFAGSGGHYGIMAGDMIRSVCGFN